MKAFGETPVRIEDSTSISDIISGVCYIAEMGLLLNTRHGMERVLIVWELHREDGPAIEANGIELWFFPWRSASAI